MDRVHEFKRVQGLISLRSGLYSAESLKLSRGLFSVTYKIIFCDELFYFFFLRVDSFHGCLQKPLKMKVIIVPRRCKMQRVRQLFRLAI